MFKNVALIHKPRSQGDLGTFFCTDICHTPHQRTSVAQSGFLGGSGRRAETHTRPAVPKMPHVPLAFPFLGRLRRQAINLTPPKRVKAWRDGPLKPEVSPVLSHIRPNRSAPTRPAKMWPRHRRESRYGKPSFAPVDSDVSII